MPFHAAPVRDPGQGAGASLVRRRGDDPPQPNKLSGVLPWLQSANRYWEAPDGYRYWRGRVELDRWYAADAEGLRRRDEDAHAIKDWDGPPWAPNGAGSYVQSANGKWWPSAKFFATLRLDCEHAVPRPSDDIWITTTDSDRRQDGGDRKQSVNTLLSPPRREGFCLPRRG